MNEATTTLTRAGHPGRFACSATHLIEMVRAALQYCPSLLPIHAQDGYESAPPPSGRRPRRRRSSPALGSACSARYSGVAKLLRHRADRRGRAVSRQPDRSSNHHIVFQLVPNALGPGPAVWRVPSRCHEIRNLSGDLIVACQAVAARVDAAEAIAEPQPARKRNSETPFSRSQPNVRELQAVQRERPAGFKKGRRTRRPWEDASRRRRSAECRPRCSVADSVMLDAGDQA
jgi:hypothetical protein